MSEEAPRFCVILYRCERCGIQTWLDKRYAHTRCVVCGGKHVSPFESHRDRDKGAAPNIEAAGEGDSPK